jgi:transposase-like protein
VAENPSFAQKEFNRAFVLMQYFGYLRRDPDAAGFTFWLGKLNAFGGDYVRAEMVKAFISSDEYRKRFGQEPRNRANSKGREVIYLLAAFLSLTPGNVIMESYFGARRVRGKRGRGASGKTIVFGIFKRNGCVYTEVVPDSRKRTLLAVIRGRVELDAVVHSDGWRGYDGLVDVGYAKHFRVNHSANEFARGASHVNGIESFWSYAKRRLQKFNGVPARTFYLHLKECEYRFNNRNKEPSTLLLKLLEKLPL